MNGSWRKTSGLAAILILMMAGCVQDTGTQPSGSAPQATSAVAGAAAATSAAAHSPADTSWWATAWTEGDGAGFHGRPVSSTTGADPGDATILVRYTRYVTDYDARLHSPVWGAYTLDRVAVANDVAGERPASNPDFARPSQFFQEPTVVAFSKTIGVVAASHATFTSTFDPRFPMLEEGEGRSAAEVKSENAARAIQRGHMVPNNAMKCQGTHDEGQVAQVESFSVANIVPQMARSNAPSWSGLEEACFDWANELGQVWLIVGPVFHEWSRPVYIRKLKGGAEQVVPSPEELFYVVIGRRGGKLAATGFLMPHVPEIVDFREHQVSVDEIEAKTGLNFMPELGEPNPIERVKDAAWLQTKPRKAGKPDED